MLPLGISPDDVVTAVSAFLRTPTRRTSRKSREQFSLTQEDVQHRKIMIDLCRNLMAIIMAIKINSNSKSIAERITLLQDGQDIPFLFDVQ